MCTSPEKKEVKNVCYDTDASAVIKEVRNDEDLSVSKNQNRSVVEDDEKSIEHTYFMENISGSCSGEKTLSIALL